MKQKLIVALLLLFAHCNLFAQKTERAFAIGDSSFLLNGKPYVIRCGEMHFARIPKPYWRQRLQMAKAMGLNTVCAYLFWNMHEKEPGKFSWEGQSDAAEFCKIAQQEGLYVILRPGPYSCAEWEFGGLPWWLLKDKTMKVRTQHSYYLQRCKQYLKEVGRRLAPLQITNGGAILMVQVENEYGSFGNDKEYLGIIRDDLKEAGFNTPFFTCDGPVQLKNDVRPDIFAAVNFGGNPENGFKALREVQPKGPLICSEYYPGWFDSWGRPHHTGSSEHVVKELSWMLDHKASFSIYMVHGGTTFGTYSGANAPPYLPQTSSYDYDAPINESGESTPKFYHLRALLEKYLQEGEKLPLLPAAIPKQAIAAFKLTQYAAVFNNLPKPIVADTASLFEDLDLPFGGMLYETTLPVGKKALLTFDEIHDFATVYVDSKFVGVIDRRKNVRSLAVPARSKPSTLRIFVEAMGRVNYGDLMHDRKGIHGAVTLAVNNAKTELKNWKHYRIPMGENNLPLSFQTTMPAKGQPMFYKGSFTTDSNADTYLDMSKCSKGLVWVNGICLGRYWNIGPTQTMFLPGCWLKKGRNEVVVFDLFGNNANPTLAGVVKPILDMVTETQATAHKKTGQQWMTGASAAHYTGSFENSAAWQSVKFKPVAARYFCIEALNSFNEQPFTTVAELELLDERGEKISRNNWKVAYADSEELGSEDGKADNVFDLQFTSIWHTQWSSAQPKHPHQLVIDLGAVKKVSGISYLPRQDGANGRIKDYRLYFSTTPFKLEK
ncbi:beta-galactosidase [Sediminibacterium soli]|uniref:beta-galactosidase n=1 Tax=Sediminibacterium soli TaxID=2698829 RepID=UPI001379626D|nr:beta-galactosidase [Sediminibacterium soli]NCI46574.1 beta-galactosidase [Sediminibacterium soli]